MDSSRLQNVFCCVTYPGLNLVGRSPIFALWQRVGYQAIPRFVPALVADTVATFHIGSPPSPPLSLPRPPTFRMGVLFHVSKLRDGCHRADNVINILVPTQDSRNVSSGQIDALILMVELAYREILLIEHTEGLNVNDKSIKQYIYI